MKDPLALITLILILGGLLIITIYILKIVFKVKRAVNEREHQKKTQELLQKQLYLQQQQIIQQQRIIQQQQINQQRKEDEKRY